MKLAFWYSGMKTPEPITAALRPFEKRLHRYVSLEQKLIDLPKGQTGEQRAIKERDKVLKQVKSGDKLILLDERGRQFHSSTFAEYLQDHLETAQHRLIFLAGASHGFHDDLHARASDKVALSQLTLNHTHVRLLFIEQLYRSFTILNNDPYHH